MMVWLSDLSVIILQAVYVAAMLLLNAISLCKVLNNVNLIMLNIAETYFYMIMISFHFLEWN